MKSTHRLPALALLALAAACGAGENVTGSDLPLQPRLDGRAGGPATTSTTPTQSTTGSDTTKTGARGGFIGSEG